MTFSKQARLCAWLGATALASPAFAGDRVADPAGAKVVADFLAAYIGKAAAPSLKVTSEGASYLVSFDLAAATAGMKGAGFSYDPAELKFRVFQQDDGQWRVEMASMPPLSGHMTPPNAKNGEQLNMRVETSNLKSVTVIDPRLAWIASSKGEAEKVSITQRGPGLDQYMELGKISANLQTQSSAQGLTTTINEPLGSMNLVMDVDPKATDPAAKGKPVHISAKGEGGVADIVMKGFQPGPLTDAWRFAAAHPERADNARDFEALKTTVNAVLADHFTLDEAVKLAKLSVATEVGPVEIEDAAIGVGVVNAGGDSGFSERFAAKSIKLPDGLVPGIYAPVVPTAFDISFKATGFDAPAAAQEWFADAHFEGDGPVLTDEARAKVGARLVRSKPIVIDIAPSHVTGPSLNLAFEGKVTIDNTQPLGTITIQVRDFDQTAQAVQQLGPQAEQKLVPVIAMAKGLSKPGPDGALIWVCDLGRDHVMKVNGLPLGKSPF